MSAFKLRSLAADSPSGIDSDCNPIDEANCFFEIVPWGKLHGRQISILIYVSSFCLGTIARVHAGIGVQVVANSVVSLAHSTIFTHPSAELLRKTLRRASAARLPANTAPPYFPCRCVLEATGFERPSKTLREAFERF